MMFKNAVFGKLSPEVKDCVCACVCNMVPRQDSWHNTEIQCG